MVINISHFTSGPRRIENAVTGNNLNANNVAVQKSVEGYISYYQPLFLSEVFGGTLGAQLDEYSRQQTQNDAEKNALIAAVQEPCADYVFFHILRDINTQTTMTGSVRLKTANTYNTSTIDIGVHTWNHMTQLLAAICASNESVKETIDSNLLRKLNNFNL